MKTISATTEYGIVVRMDSIRTKHISFDAVLQAMEVESPWDHNEELASFGPSFGEEAMYEFARRLQGLGLEINDDFCTMALDVPAWCSVHVGCARAP